MIWGWLLSASKAVNHLLALEWLGLKLGTSHKKLLTRGEGCKTEQTHAECVIFMQEKNCLAKKTWASFVKKNLTRNELVSLSCWSVRVAHWQTKKHRQLWTVTLANQYLRNQIFSIIDLRPWVIHWVYVGFLIGARKSNLTIRIIIII